MEKHLTLKEAFEDFFAWLKTQEVWKTTGRMTRLEKQYIYKARQHLRAGRLGPDRLDGLLEKYAPGRYTRSTFYTINESI